MISYGIEAGDFRAEKILSEDDSNVFDIIFTNGKIEGLRLRVPGYHNIENTIGAIVVCKQMGISDQEIKGAIETYQGVKRRFEYIINREEFKYIDDYAHHPSELNSVIDSVHNT